MGVLDIRGQSARLGNIAGLPRINVNTGAVERWGAVRQAIAEDARGQQAIGRGIAELGRGISDATKTLGAMLEKEDERKFDKYYTSLSQGLDDHYEGKLVDGMPTGALYQPIGDEGMTPEKWGAEGQKAEDKAKVKAIEDAGISDEDAARYEKDKRIISLRRNWASRKNAAVASANDRSNQKASDAILNKMVEKAVDFGTDDSADLVIDETKKNCKAHHIYAPEAQAAEVAKNMQLVENGRLKTLEGTYQSEEAWDEAIKQAKDGKYWDEGFNDVLGRAYGWAEEKKAAIEQGKKDHDPAKAHGAKIAEALTKAKANWRRQAEAAEVQTKKANANGLLDGLKSFADSTVDTNVAMKNRGQFESCEAYDKRIDQMVDAKQLDAKDGEKFKRSYRGMVDHIDSVTKAVKAGRGVWTKVKDRKGNVIDVFQPDKMGNGKAETDPTLAAKYTVAGRDGKMPYFDNPSAGMEELDYDLQMGNISVPFYNAQMSKMRVLSNTKAKAAFVKIFGAEPTIFSEKDIAALAKEGIDVSHKTVWAKNRWWAGNHNVGDEKATWQEDALKKDGGEFVVTLDQEAQMMEMILTLSAEGIDPTDALQSYLAPTFGEWAHSDLKDRLDPTRKVNGKTFAQTVLESNRFGEKNGPATRKERTDARKKAAYGDLGTKAETK